MIPVIIAVRTVKMKIIYAGYSKCGTKTMNAALTELGYNVYDYMENIAYLHDDWMKIFKHGGSVEDFRRMYEDVDAVTDAPCYFFWEEILEAFPDAKIIFSKRDDEAWLKSVKHQMDQGQGFIFRIMEFLSPTSRRLNNYGLYIMRICFAMEADTRGWNIFGKIKYNDTMLLKRYRTHNEYVLKNVPKDKLLVIDFKQGWEPLCEFLNQPVPDVPFPHKNKKGVIIKELMESDPLMLRMQREVLVSTSLLTLLVGYGVFKLATRSSSSESLLSYISSPIRNLFGSFK